MTNRDFKNLLSMEIVARVCKNIMRNKMRILKSSKREDFQKAVSRFYNLVFISGPKSQYWWENTCKRELLKRFSVNSEEGESLAMEVEALNYEYIASHVDWKWLWDRLDFFLGVEWRKTIASRQEEMLAEKEKERKLYIERADTSRAVLVAEKPPQIEEGHRGSEGVCEDISEPEDRGAYSAATSFEELISLVGGHSIEETPTEPSKIKEEILDTGVFAYRSVQSSGGYFQFDTRVREALADRDADDDSPEGGEDSKDVKFKHTDVKKLVWVFLQLALSLILFSTSKAHQGEDYELSRINIGQSNLADVR